MRTFAPELSPVQAPSPARSPVAPTPVRPAASPFSRVLPSATPRIPTPVAEIAAAQMRQRAVAPLAGWLRHRAEEPQSEAIPPPVVRGDDSASTLPMQMACAGGCRCSTCSGDKAREDEERRLREAGIQRAAEPDGGPMRVDAASVQARLTGGAPLPAPIAERFSQAYGRDLSHVRVHAGSALAPQVGARAFTVGRDVAFAPGEYAPGTPEGDRLIGHELAHVVQQSGGAGVMQGAGLGSDGYEREADRAAEAALSGGRVSGLSRLSGAAGGRIQLRGAAGAGGAGGADAGAEAGTPGADSSGGLGTGDGGEPGGAGSAAPAPSLEPCAVNVASLTNAQLLARFAEADAYVMNPEHYRRDSYYQYLSLRRRAGAEREARARAGECWLADNVTSVPGMLYRLEPGPRGGVIIRGEAGSAAGAARSFTDVSVVTDGQLQSYLNRNHVTPATYEEVMRDPKTPHMVDVATAQMVWAMEHPKKEPPPMFSPLVTPGGGGAIGTFTGLPPAGPGATTLDLMAYNQLLQASGGGGMSADWLASRGWPGIPGQKPSFLEAFTGNDLKSAAALLTQRPGAVGIASEGIFLPPEAMIAMFQARGGVFIPESLPQSLPVPHLDEVMSRYPMPEGRLPDAAENASALLVQDLPFEEMIRVAERINANTREPNRPIVLDLMPYALRHLRPGGTLDLVYAEASISDEVRTSMSKTWVDPATGRVYRLEYVSPITQVTAKAAAPDSPGMGGAIANARQQVFQVKVRKVPVTGSIPATGGHEGEGLATMQVSPLGRTPLLWGAGTGAAGNVVGGMTLAGLQRAYAALRGRPYAGTAGGDLRNIAVSTPPAALLAMAQLRMEQMALQRAAAGGASAMPLYLSPAAIRFGLPALTAPLMTMAVMGLDGHTHPWQEYMVQGSRAGFNAAVASGVTAGFFMVVGASAAAGAKAGAVGGTVVEPGGGTLLGGAGGWLVGAIVGSVAYFVSDLTIGSAVENATRSLVGEPDGCP